MQGRLRYSGKEVQDNISVSSGIKSRRTPSKLNDLQLVSIFWSGRPSSRSLLRLNKQRQSVCRLTYPQTPTDLENSNREKRRWNSVMCYAGAAWFWWLRFFSGHPPAILKFLSFPDTPGAVLSVCRVGIMKCDLLWSSLFMVSCLRCHSR
jgi:hypothetical protein